QQQETGQAQAGHENSRQITLQFRLSVDEGQYWQPLLQQITVRSLNLGQADQILKNGSISNRRGWESPPGELLASLISGKKEDNKVKTCSEKQ
ncbi:MAG: hypothetical protein EZS28_044299, partial [Streblomastix strix]